MSSQHAKWVIDCETFAANNMPPVVSGVAGQGVPAALGYPTGDMYCGWPISTLISAALPGLSFMDRFQVEREFRNKHMSNINFPAVPGQFGGGAGGFAVSVPKANAYSLRELLEARMRWGKGDFGDGFAHMDVYKAAGIVHLWIITKDNKSVVLEDEWVLFPSDALVSKILLLQQGET